MRAGRVVVAVLLVAAVVVVALAMTGKLPPAMQGGLGTLASAWTASSSDAGSTDGGADAGRKPQAAGLSSAQLSAPLYHNASLATCGAPPEMRVVIKATVQMGRAIDVQVTTDPPDPTVEVCIEQATRNLRWDPSRKTDHLTVRY